MFLLMHRSRYYLWQAQSCHGGKKFGAGMFSMASAWMLKSLNTASLWSLGPPPRPSPSRKGGWKDLMQTAIRDAWKGKGKGEGMFDSPEQSWRNGCRATKIDLQKRQHVHLNVCQYVSWSAMSLHCDWKEKEGRGDMSKSCLWLLSHVTATV